MQSVSYIARADWMWHQNRWVVSKLAFCPVYDPDDTLVILPRKESWGSFTYAEIQKNCTVHPLHGFVEEAVQGHTYWVDLIDMEAFLVGDFYPKTLKDPDAWDVKIGTHDMATFMFLEPLLGDKVEYLGAKVNVEMQVKAEAKCKP